MPILGHLVCQKWREEFGLGKWIWDEAGIGLGFRHPRFAEDCLGSKALHFLAKHLDHGVQVISIETFSEKFDMIEYREVDDELRDHALDQK
jgi:hypothetical protein